MATDTDGAPEQFEDVDWESLDDGGIAVPASTAVFLVLFAVLVGVFLYDVYVLGGGPLYGGWDVSAVDYMTLFFGVVAVGYGLVPAVLEPERVGWAWNQYPKDVLSLVALVYVVLLVLVGVFGPVLVDQPAVDFDQSGQPPVYTSVEAFRADPCQGTLVGDDYHGQCYGTWKHPLGTTGAGESVLAWIVLGTRTALQFSLVAVVIMGPIAIAVGTVTAYYGGWVRRIGMGYVDVQQSVPTVVVYLFLLLFFNAKLIVLIAAYGLFDWGNVARLVHGESLTERNAEYVLAAESAGAGPFRVIRHHLIPNTADTTLTAVTVLIPRLILIEALWSYLGLAGGQSYSWGQLILRAELAKRGPGQLLTLWWVPVVPVVVLSVTIVMLNLFGDGLQTVVDSRR